MIPVLLASMFASGDTVSAPPLRRFVGTCPDPSPYVAEQRRADRARTEGRRIFIAELKRARRQARNVRNAARIADARSAVRPLKRMREPDEIIDFLDPEEDGDAR